MKSRVLFLFLYVPFLVFGQINTIDTVEVRATSIREQAIGTEVQAWNMATLQKSTSSTLAELLSTESTTFIKHYGAASLATSSIRGGSAGHTLVLWNGFPLQSPMLGLLDMSLLPIQSAEHIRLQKGGNTALWGSGAIGGVLALDNAPDFSASLALQVQSEFGSFGKWAQEVQIGFGNARFQSRTKVLHQQADNDFYYQIREDLPLIQQTNAHFSQQNILQDFYWKLKNQQHLSIHFWQQFASRQIPPTIVQNRSEAAQDDRATRLLLEWKKLTPNGLWQAKTGLFKETIYYTNPLEGVDAPSGFTSLISELNRQWTWRQQRLHIGTTHSYTQAEADGYRGDVPKENKSALFASYQLEQAKWQAQLSARQSFVDGAFVPFVSSAGLDFQPLKALAIQAKVSKNYRLPTLNDRYWRPGGNPDLKAESGWSEELTVATNFKLKKLKGTFSSTLFHRKIDNWILWSIEEGQSFWSANNITNVWSRGLEERLHLNYKKENLDIHLDIAYDYIRSTNEVALEKPRIAKGQQLYYTPIHQAFAKVAVTHKAWYAHYRHAYTGASEGINMNLEDYDLGQLRLQYAFDLGELETKLFLNVYNIWDKAYFVIERRAMAGRHFSIGIRANYRIENKLIN